MIGQQHHESGAHFAFTDRWGGVSAAPYDQLNLGGAVGDDPQAVRANRARAAVELGLDPAAVVWMNQVHGRDVAVVDGPWYGDDIPAVDAVVTDRRGLALAVLTADCTPVLLADPVAGVAGRRTPRPGLVAGVVPAVVEAMVKRGAVAGADRRVHRTGDLRAVLRGARGDAFRCRRGGARGPCDDQLGHSRGGRHRGGTGPTRRGGRAGA